MKKTMALILTVIFSLAAITGCSDSKLKKDDPVTLTMWHVYGEQADSPMNRLVDEFNETVGKEKGIIIDVTMMSNAVEIGNKLLESQKGSVGAVPMPDLFPGHKGNAAELGVENLIDWKDYFTAEELKNYIPEFISDGTIDDKLPVFPVSKSTHLLFISGSLFDRFSADTGITYDDLDTWDGFFDAAQKYYEWSGGKPFCALDYPLRCMELNAMEKCADNFYTSNGWYDFDNEIFHECWNEFSSALAKGYVVMSDLYSNTQVMTGEVAAGIGSSASILYYNDTITYPNNISEPMNLQVMPIPKAKGKDLIVTQAGVGLCAYKTTDQKAEAAAEFVRWLTDSDRNLKFCADTGYMPVNKGSFEKINDFPFKNEAYKNLYSALDYINKNAVAVSEPSFNGYYNKVHTFYDDLRQVQKTMPERYRNGESADTLTAEIWEMFKNIQ